MTKTRLKRYSGQENARKQHREKKKGIQSRDVSSKVLKGVRVVFGSE